MKTLKQVAMFCLIAVFVLAIVAQPFGLSTATSSSAGLSVHASHILLDELPTPTPTLGASTNSNPSGGDGGG